MKALFIGSNEKVGETASMNTENDAAVLNGNLETVCNSMNIASTLQGSNKSNDGDNEASMHDVVNVICENTSGGGNLDIGSNTALECDKDENTSGGRNVNIGSNTALECDKDDNTSGGGNVNIGSNTSLECSKDDNKDELRLHGDINFNDTLIKTFVSDHDKFGDTNSSLTGDVHPSENLESSPVLQENINVDTKAISVSSNSLKDELFDNYKEENTDSNPDNSSLTGDITPLQENHDSSAAVLQESSIIDAKDTTVASDPNEPLPKNNLYSDNSSVTDVNTSATVQESIVTGTKYDNVSSGSKVEPVINSTEEICVNSDIEKHIAVVSDESIETATQSSSIESVNKDITKTDHITDDVSNVVAPTSEGTSDPITDDVSNVVAPTSEGTSDHITDDVSNVVAPTSEGTSDHDVSNVVAPTSEGTSDHITDDVSNVVAPTSEGASDPITDDVSNVVAPTSEGTSDSNVDEAQIKKEVQPPEWLDILGNGLLKKKVCLFIQILNIICFMLSQTNYCVD